MERAKESRRALPRLEIGVRSPSEAIGVQNTASPGTDDRPWNMDGERKLNEPLLGHSKSRKIHRKSDHPFLSLISPSPRRNRTHNGWALDSASSASPSPHWTTEQERMQERHHNDIASRHSHLSRQQSNHLDRQHSIPPNRQHPPHLNRQHSPHLNRQHSPHLTRQHTPVKVANLTRQHTASGSRHPHPRLPRRDSVSSTGSNARVSASRKLIPDSPALHSIPEDSPIRNSCHSTDGIHGSAPDVESLLPEEPNYTSADDSDSGFFDGSGHGHRDHDDDHDDHDHFGEWPDLSSVDDSSCDFFGVPPSDEEGNQEKRGKRWKASNLTNLFLSAIPATAIEVFTASPEDELYDYGTGERIDNHQTPTTAHPNTPCATAGALGAHYDSDPCLPRLDIPPQDKDSVEKPPPNPFSAPSSICDGNGEYKPKYLTDDCIVRMNSLQKKGLHKCRTAPMLTGLGNFHPKKAEKQKAAAKPQKVTAASVVWQASVGLCIYLAVGVVVYTWKREEFTGAQTIGVVDALYFCIVTMCTIGYGDITPITPTAKILSCMLVFVGFGFIDALMSGMLSFVLDRQEHLLLNVVEDGRHERAKNYIMDSKKGRMRIRMKVFLAVLTVIMFVTIGVVFLHHFEDMAWIDALYVTSISITTVGFGDYAFQTMWGRLFAAVWLLASTLGVARAFLFLAEARVHRRSRHLAKKILQRKMTSDDLMTMDLDNDGHISKSEFVVYKLKEMGKISEGDVVEIVKQFDFIDSMGAGKITVGQLLDGEK